MTQTATASAPRVGVRKINLLSAHGLAFLRDSIEAMRRSYDRYGPLVEFELRVPLVKEQRFLLAVGPRYNERALGDPATFGSGGLMLPGPRGSAHRRIRAGLVAMDGRQHAHYRALLLPPLKRAAIDGMIGRIGEIVQTAIGDWRRGEVVDLWPLVQNVARRVAVATLFGARTADDVAEALTAADLVNNHGRMAGSPQVRNWPINWRGLPYWRMLRHAEAVEANLRSWAAKRRGKPQGDDLLSLIVNSPDEHGSALGDDRVANQVLTLFGASFETCQSALIWTLFLLAQHPDACAALHDELSSLPDPLSAARLEQCTWLGAVVKEGMRLLPPVPVQVRKALRDTDLIDCDVKRATRVLLSPFLTNRLPDLYPDGDRFKPQRWSSIAPSQYEYLVFSAGPRTCIGYWFAMTFVKVALAHIVRTYRLTVVPGARIDHQIAVAMWPGRGIPVVIYAQDRRFEASPIRGSVCRLVRG